MNNANKRGDELTAAIRRREMSVTLAKCLYWLSNNAYPPIQNMGIPKHAQANHLRRAAGTRSPICKYVHSLN